MLSCKLNFKEYQLHWTKRAWWPQSAYKRLSPEQQCHVQKVEYVTKMDVIAKIPCQRWFYDACYFLPAPHIVHLELQDYYNLPLPEVPNLLFLKLGDHFNQSLQLPNSLKTLVLGYDFNQPLLLPPGLTRLDVNPKFQQMLELPVSLLTLKYNSSFPLPMLPSWLLHLHLGLWFEHPLPEELPPLLEILELGDLFTSMLPRLPSTLKQLRLGQLFNHPLPDLPSGLISLNLGRDFSHPLPSLPTGLLYLYLGNSFFHMFVVPPNLKYLLLGHFYGQPLLIPDNTKVEQLRCSTTNCNMHTIKHHTCKQFCGIKSYYCMSCVADVSQT